MYTKSITRQTYKMKLTIQIYQFMILITFVSSLRVKPVAKKKNELLCNKITKTKSFREDFVMGLPWRTFYSWVVRLDRVCLDMEFRKPTNTTIKNYARVMGRHTLTIPLEDATLLGVDEVNNQQLLLIPKPGAPGRFQAVFNLLKEVEDPLDREYILKNGLPILHFGFKMFRKGLFLLRWDCIGGIGHLMARVGTVNKTDVLSMVQALNFSKGHIACTGEEDHKASGVIVF